MKNLVAPAAAIAAFPCWAAEGSAGTLWSLMQMLLGLALVLGLIIAASWALRRLGPGAAASGSAIRVITAASVGPRERVVLVEINDTWLVLGVAPGRVAALHQLPRQALPAIPERRAAGFAAWLADARRRQAPAP